MHLLDLIKNTFLQPRPSNPEDLAPEEIMHINFKVVVVEFADNVEGNCGELVTAFLQSCEGLSVSYFNEPFNKTFLNFESRTLFDLVDKGQDILEKTGADVLVWGYRENDKIRLNFQTSAQYGTEINSVVSLLDCLYFPAALFEQSGIVFPSSLVTLLYGAIVSALNFSNKSAQIQKRYLLKKIVDRLSADNSAKALSIEYLPYVMNFLGIIYMSSCSHIESEKDFKIVKGLLETALKHQDLINSPIHLGCIYNHLGQLYDYASTGALKRLSSYYRNAISNYRLAQKYWGKYNYPYDYGLISYRLSELYYNYWKQKEELQALRDSVFQLRESERIFTYALFPEFWADIEGRLGYLLSVLSSLTASDEIAELAIAAYKNRQKIITEKRDPLLWAQIQEKIGEIYYRIGKNESDKDALEESLEYYHDALYVFENMSLREDSQRLTASIAKTNQVLSYQ